MSTVLSNIAIDAGFIRNMMGAHGPVEAIAFMQKCFTSDMNTSIEDGVLRLMVWQVTHSLEVLEEKTSQQYWTLADVERMAITTDDKDTHTTARHIIGALDLLSAHVLDTHVEN